MYSEGKKSAHPGCKSANQNRVILLLSEGADTVTLKLKTFEKFSLAV